MTCGCVSTLHKRNVSTQLDTLLRIKEASKGSICILELMDHFLVMRDWLMRYQREAEIIHNVAFL